MNKSNEPDHARLIAEAITEHWGERCPDYTNNYPTYQTWKQFDDLRTLSDQDTGQGEESGR